MALTTAIVPAGKLNRRAVARRGDLGMEPRLAFFSDVHGNTVALRAVLGDLKTQTVDGVYCLGNLVGYGPDPNGVVELLRSEGIPCLLGNYYDGVAF